MTMKVFLESTPAPSSQDIRVALSGNFCRCTGYQQIVEAVNHAAALLSNGTKGRTA